MMMTLLAFYGFRIVYGPWLPCEYKILADLENSQWLTTGKFVLLGYKKNY